MDQFRARGKKPTHVLMNGGTLHVSPDRLNEFNYAYYQSIRNGERLFVVEQKTTPCYKMFLDLDYVDEEALTVENVQSIVHIICDKASTFMPHDNTCVISVAQPKPKGDLIKTGVHLNWPNCVVDQGIALNLRDHIIFHLSKIYSVKDWSKIVDRAVFGDPNTGSGGSGFRLPWSYKKSKDVVEGPYIPFFVYRNGKIVNIASEPITVRRIEDVTIRTEETEPNIQVEPVQVFSMEEKKHTSKPKGKEIENPEALAHLETFIRRYMNGQADARLQKLMRDKNVYAIQTNSKYCENLGREHSSNHVWFLVKKTGTVCQKCFCTCETTKGRKYKMCKDFSGREHMLPKTIMYLLYPEKEQEDLNKLKKLGLR